MLRSAPLPPVPAETARITHAAFPTGHAYLAAADALGEVFTDDTFAALYRRRGSPGWPHGGSRSRPSCNSRKACPIARRPTPCAPA
jgi:hypothetical protein